jgi:diguanylate cyclase (GGDEF)-like protein
MLDERTLFVVMVVMPGLLALVAIALRRGFGEDARGFGLWSLAMACVALASARIAWEGAAVGFALQNLFWVGFMLAMAAAFSRFGKGRTLPVAFVVAAVGVYLGSLALVGSPRFDAARIALLSLFAAACFASTALSVRHRPAAERGLGPVFVGVGALLGLLATGYRALEGLLEGTGLLFMAGDGAAPVIWVFQAGLLSGLTLMTVGLILLAASRVRQRINDASTHDPLTGLPNRQEFQRRLMEAATASRGSATTVALALVGLDDVLGARGASRSAGVDIALHEMAESLARLAPPGSVVACIGGSELAVLMPCGDRDEALRWAEAAGQRIVADAARLPDRAVVVNVGVAFGRSDADPGTLFSLAEAALYHAKDSEAGRAVLA